jgi:hypothetical protein
MTQEPAMGRSIHLPPIHHSLAALAVVLATAAAVADDAEGVVRISSDPHAGLIVRGQSSEITLVSRRSAARKASRQAEESAEETADIGESQPVSETSDSSGTAANTAPLSDCPPAAEGGIVYDCPPGGYEPHCVLGGNCVANCLRRHCMMRKCRTRATSDALAACFHQGCAEKCAWMQCKFGYFIPSGCCGKGCPPHGCYSMVYPLNSNYFDARDGQVYAAQGYAGPVSVPLAPVVHHTYNYGWGIPSSRLTPISHPIPGY